MKCENCGYEFSNSEIGAMAGHSTSVKKAKASRANGAKGGRPRKAKPIAPVN